MRDTDERLKKEYKIDFKFILAVSASHPQKNLLRLISAYDILKKKFSIPHKIVIVGSRGRDLKKIYRLLEELELKEHIILKEVIPHQNLPLFYQGADLFVFPSLSESFGLPALEAMACGTPIVCSKGGALPEIVGDAGVFFEPFSCEDMASAIYKVLANEELKTNLSVEGIKRANNFSWEKTAKKTLDLFNEII